MSKTLALMWPTVLWVAYFLLTGILILPYGMGEPGGPKGTPEVAGPIISAGVTTTGCWIGRYHLRQADVHHR